MEYSLTDAPHGVYTCRCFILNIYLHMFRMQYSLKHVRNWACTYRCSIWNNCLQMLFGEFQLNVLHRIYTSTWNMFHLEYTPLTCTFKKNKKKNKCYKWINNYQCSSSNIHWHVLYVFFMFCIEYLLTDVPHRGFNNTCSTRSIHLQMFHMKYSHGSYCGVNATPSWPYNIY